MNAKPKKPPVCRDCEAPIIFAITAKGSRMPLDKQRDASGQSRHAVSHAADGNWYVRTLAAGERPGRAEYLHNPHFATCAARKGQPTLLEVPERTEPN